MPSVNKSAIHIFLNPGNVKKVFLTARFSVVSVGTDASYASNHVTRFPRLVWSHLDMGKILTNKTYVTRVLLRNLAFTSCHSLHIASKMKHHKENSPVTQTTPEPTLLSWGGWPREKKFPHPWPHCQTQFYRAYQATQTSLFSNPLMSPSDT